ncbi:Brain chitinase and chia, partial [Operophtera brumata]
IHRQYLDGDRESKDRQTREQEKEQAQNEGFYQHPRDCKKYFWCLDSGPSNLGIVAHQFTCPSGLFFNKAADSCDFARNVLCKLPAETTKAPATKAPKTTAAPVTTRKPIKLSTKDSALFRTTTTTVAPEPESEEEYEEEVLEDTFDEDSEDPRRSETYVSVSEQPNSLDVASARKENQPEYVTIRRQRPTTEEATTIQYEEANSEVDIQETALEREISSQPQYTSIVRARSTTSPPQDPSTEQAFTATRPTTYSAPEESSPEPTTVLAVQISSLLNSPNSAEDTSAPATAQAQTEADVVTTSTAAPSSATPRRSLLRRRGSTTTTTPAPSSSTTQVSPRNYSFIRRRQPIAKPNEILDSDDDIELSRKIRSTTPDSREVGGVRETGSVTRFRSRYRPSNDDSVTAAASPVSRGQFRPRLNQDEVISLTPVDVEPQFIPRQSLNQRTARRFLGRTTAADAVVDSEASAATVEAKRPDILPRGRGRFGAGTTTETKTSPPATEPTPSQRRPTFARFSPRPFARASSVAPITESEIEDNIASSTQRIPPRLPFGRTRPVSSTTASVVRARKLPFPSRITTTPQSLVSESDDETENKNEDIFLSESAIEEKEHQVDIEDEIPNRRVVIKKLRTTIATEDSPTETIPIDDSGKKKFRIIRRRPVSTSAPTETEVPTEVPAPQRIRKVIRKKINRIVEDEPEIIAKSIGSHETFKVTSTVAPITETVINYGERRKASTASIVTTPITTTTEQVTERVLEEVSEVVKEEVTESEPENEKSDDDKESDTKNEHIEITVNKEEKIEIAVKDQSGDTNTSNDENDNKPEVVVESEQKAINLSENKENVESDPTTTEAEESSPETSTASTTTLTSTSRSRIPYRPNKRIFTSTTEAVPSSSRTFSRKFNPGVYTSPATVTTRAPPAFRSAGARRPAFASQFTRKPFTTARTTTRLEEEEDYSDEELLEEEPENPFAFVPPSQLYTRKPDANDEESELEDGSEELLEEGEPLEPEDESEDEPVDEPQNPFIPTTKRPFRPKLVNSNTFRTSTSTTEIPRRFGAQNKTALYNRFASNKAVNDTKKRVQNVPLGYSGLTTTSKIKSNKNETQGEQAKKDVTTVTPTTEYDTTTEDEYLSMSDSTSTLIDSTNTDTLSTNTIDTETSTFQMEISTEDYLENTEQTTYYPTTQDASAQTTLSHNTVVNTETVTENTLEPTTNAPVIKTQFDKLFSVSRVVEVSSKLDKHRLNKNNETTHIEEGKVMVEKKPVVDKIGEVSRFSLIKILEDEIPIYLTKFRHVYPVENPPDNLIRIDEARNARALTSYAEPPREHLVASESINEAYRHIKKVSDLAKKDEITESEVERIPSDVFLSYVNEDKKSEALEEDPLFAQWQFVPAAYENEQSNLNKAAMSFEVVTPHSMRTHQSTLPLEGLFQSETPITARKLSEDKSQPFLVYSSPVSKQEDVNIVKLEVLKPETGRSIITSAKGQEFSGSSTVKEATTKSSISVSVLPKTEGTTTSTPISPSTSTTEAVKTSPLVEMLSTPQTTVTEPTTTDEPSTTETIPDETTTVTISPLEAKRAKYGFPRRPLIKSSNSTRFNVPRTVTRKANTTVTGNLITKINKTSTFTPNKSRFSAARAQNVPVDIRKKINNRLTTRLYTTEAPRTTTERKLYFKPIRSTFRPAFVPRKNTPSQISEES